MLRDYVMDPIGASNTWRWYGYDNSWVVLDGQLVQSVTGGGHWGGGMWISARDMARFGYLTLTREMGGRQILSDEWVRMATTPASTRHTASATSSSTPAGARCRAPRRRRSPFREREQLIYVDPENDLVVVARWINSTRSLDAMMKALLADAR